MDGIAYLMHKTYKEDKIGQQVSADERIKIFVSEKTLTQTEYFKAGQNGMNPAIMLTTAAINYSGESTIEYENVLYGIYRTFQKPDSDEIELYLHKKGGV